MRRNKHIVTQITGQHELSILYCTIQIASTKSFTPCHSVHLKLPKNDIGDLSKGISQFHITNSPWSSAARPPSWVAPPCEWSAWSYRSLIRGPMGNPVQLPIITLFMFSMPFETPSSESQWEKMKKMDEAKTNLLWMDSCWLYLEFLEVRSYLGKFSLPKPPCWASRSLVLQNQVGPPTLQGFDGGDSCEKSHDKVEQYKEENENLRQQKVTSRRLFFVFQQSCILWRYFLAKSKKVQSYWP